MKYIKLFENFDSIYPKLHSTLIIICRLYKNEILGDRVHVSESFDGQSISELAKETLQLNQEYSEKIASILSKISECCEMEVEGELVHISEFISDDDCNYISDMLALPRLDFYDEWTEEEKNYYDQD